LLALGGLVAMALAWPSPTPAQETDEEEVQELREQLTEREDENRVEDPLTLDLLGHPLTLNAQYEGSLDYIDRESLGDGLQPQSRLLLEQEIEPEAFFTMGPAFSAFVQVRLVQEEDLENAAPDSQSDLFLERGEMWLYSEEIAGSPISLEAGRLDFEDDRLWWWDEDLDAVRAYVEVDDVEVAFAVAREMAPNRSDRDHVDPEQDHVLRLITEASWDWADNHALQLFLLSHDDRSRTEQPGQLLATEPDDESDADLRWAGVRLSGAWDLEERGQVGYWIDTGFVEGDEDLVEAVEPEVEEEEPADEEEDEEAAEPEPPAGPVAEIFKQDVDGWALDLGFTWRWPVWAEPRFSAGYAYGSGDDNPDDRTDHAFRQTGLHGNESGFGGAQRFQGYGELLDPELSNLEIFTVGIGCSLFESSSADLIFHEYRLAENSDSLRDARLDAALTGTNRDVGRGADLVVALEEWDRVEFEVTASCFRAGDAFGPDEGEWVFGCFGAARLAF
jgi:hypothetical protein